jgi:hypothetical protein
MTNKDEALKIAIEALEQACGLTPRDAHFCKAINACKEALEQPAQDYVLICKRCGDDLGIEYVPDEQPAQEPVALIKHENGNYSPKHQWQGLNDDEITGIELKSLIGNPADWDVEPERFARAIEQALKEKNTVTER